MTAESVATEWLSWRFGRIGSGCNNSSQSCCLAEQLAFARGPVHVEASATNDMAYHGLLMEASELAVDAKAVEAATVDALQSEVRLNRRWWKSTNGFDSSKVCGCARD